MSAVCFFMCSPINVLCPCLKKRSATQHFPHVQSYQLCVPMPEEGSATQHFPHVQSYRLCVPMPEEGSATQTLCAHA